MGELVGLLGRVAEAIFTRLPAVLIAWKYPPKKVADSFFIELGSPRGVQIALQGTNPRVMLYLRAVNLSPIWIEVEGLDIRVSIGHQEIHKGQHFKRRRIEGFTAFPAFGYGHRGWGTDHLTFDLPVESGRASAVTAMLPKWSGSVDVQLRAEAYGRCKTGPIERTDVSFDIPAGATGVS